MGRGESGKSITAKGANEMRKGLLAACLALACSAAYANFDDWDRDGDDQISEQEFYSAVREAARFDAVDEDNDGLVDEEEFDDAEIDGDWDQWAGDDSYLDADELYGQTFDAFDEDGDGNWDEDEYDEAGETDWLDL